MSDTWITCARAFDGASLQRNVSLRIEDGIITEFSTQKRGTKTIEGLVTPGYLDLQVNGGGGVLLNTNPSVEGMAAIAAAHRGLGTVGILPTVITDAPQVLDQAVEAALAAKGAPGILGLHIEGPHIATAKRGTHDAAFIRPLDDRTCDLAARLRAAGVTTLLTLAPEAATPAQISRLAGLGVIVSLGHTNATADEVAAAIRAGASCGTHLFNAMSQMTSRAPGAVGAILDAGIPFGLICDGHHVDERMIRLALRASAVPRRAFLVSDAMATVGGPDQFELYGATIRLDAGRLINAEGALAGAHICQAEGVQRLVHQIGVPLKDALHMAITTPARLLGRPDLAALAGRSVNDVIVLNDALCPTALADALS